MNRQEIKQELKQRKTPTGVFAVRCTTSGEIWVSGSANLVASRNGTMFMLRNGTHHNRAIQAAWNCHGEAAFQWEIVETFEEDLAAMAVRDTMRDRQKFWAQKLSAAIV